MHSKKTLPAAVNKIILKHAGKPGALLSILKELQEQTKYNYIEKEVLELIASKMKIPMSGVYSFITFYAFFNLEPQGEHNCIVCMGTACYVKRAAEVVAALQDAYGIEPGETTPDGQFSLATARCLGSCGLAPVLIVDDEVLGRETPESTLARVQQLLAAEERRELVL